MLCEVSQLPEVSVGQPNSDALRAVGPTIEVVIGFPGDSDSSDRSIRCTALIDTGAEDSCIDSALAARLGLPVVETTTGSGIQGASPFNMHLAQVDIPSVQRIRYDRFMAVHLAQGGQQYCALLGREFLALFTMTYEGRTGTVIISDEESNS